MITNTTINFRSSSVQSNGQFTSPTNSPINDIPNELLLNDSILRDSLGLDYKFPKLTISRSTYDSFIKEFKFELVQGGRNGYSQAGSTFFSFFFPAPASEDTYMIKQLLSSKIVSQSFALAISMVDFYNPVFSSKRNNLLKYAANIEAGSINGGKSSVVSDFVAAVKASGAVMPSDESNYNQWSAEQQFLYIWQHANAKKAATNLVSNYLDKLSTMSDMEKLSFLMHLAQKRRYQFTQIPRTKNLDEFSLLLPQNTLIH